MAYGDPHPAPATCPHCGYCPTCGRANAPRPVVPAPYWVGDWWPTYPMVTTVWRYDTNTTVAPSTATTREALAEAFGDLVKRVSVGT